MIERIQPLSRTVERQELDPCNNFPTRGKTSRSTIENLAMAVKRLDRTQPSSGNYFTLYMPIYYYSQKTT